MSEINCTRGVFLRRGVMDVLGIAYHFMLSALNRFGTFTRIGNQNKSLVNYLT